MILIAAWVGVASLLGYKLRKAGPWWKVTSGALAWPAWPALAAGSKIQHSLRRRARQRRASP